LQSLIGFIRSGVALSPEILNLLAKDLFGANVRFDPQRNLLVRTSPQARPLGRSTSIAEMDLQLPKFVGGPAPVRPRNAALPGAQPRRSPGWATE
jgi:hypothetical protein